MQCRALPQGASVVHVFEMDRVAAIWSVQTDTDCCPPVLHNVSCTVQRLNRSHLMSHDEHMDDTRSSVAPVNQPVRLVAQR